jgi:hypothetical protein
MAEDVREELALGYKKGFTELNESRMEHWAEPELENVSRGELAAIVFYGACVRECMSRGIDDPMQAHLVALGALAVFEEDDFDSVVYYLVGKPLPSRVTDVIEYYKTNLQSDLIKTMGMANDMLNSMQIRFETELGIESDDDAFDLDVDDFDLEED